MIISTAAAGGGHLGADTLSQLPSAQPPARARPRSRSASHRCPPGTRACRWPARASPTPKPSRLPRTTPTEDNLSLSLIALLVGAAVNINTLVIATLQRRGEIAVLSRVGATMRQLTATAACQAGAVTLIGFVLGASRRSSGSSIRVGEADRVTPDVPALTVITGSLRLVASIATMAILAAELRIITKEEGRRN